MFTSVIRTVILYILVIFAMRIMGKRQIADMQPTELAVTLLISEIAAIPIQDSSQPVLTAVSAIFALVSFEFIMAYLTLKSNLINNLTNGKSAVIIKRGRILQHRMKKLRLTVDDLVEMLREQGIFDIREVSYAIFETNGKLSVLQKPQYRNAKVGDVSKAKKEKDGCPILIISDGSFVKRGLDDLEIEQSDVIKLLNKRGCMLKDVMIMTLDCYGEMVVIEKEKEF